MAGKADCVHLKKDDHVRLNKDWPPGRAGDEGIVRHRDAKGRLTVELVRRADCSDFTALLPPVAEDYFELGWQCP